MRLYFRLQRSYCLKPAVSVGDRDGWSATTATVNTRVRARSAVCSSAIVATESLFHVLLSVYNSRNTAQTGAAIVRVWSNKSVREPEGRSLALKLNWCTKWWMNLLKVGRWGSLKDGCLDSSLFFFISPAFDCTSFIFIRAAWTERSVLNSAWCLNVIQMDPNKVFCQCGFKIQTLLWAGKYLRWTFTIIKSLNVASEMSLLGSVFCCVALTVI